MSLLADALFLLALALGFGTLLCAMLGVLYAWDCRREIGFAIRQFFVSLIEPLRARITRRRYAKHMGWVSGWTHSRNRRSA